MPVKKKTSEIAEEENKAVKEAVNAEKAVAEKEAKPAEEPVKEEPKKEKEAKPAPKKAKPAKGDNPKEAKEPAVAADFDEEKIAKPARKTAKKTDPVRNVGTMSADIENEIAFNSVSRAEEEDRTYRYMRKCKNNGEILVGKIVGVETDKSRMILGVRLAFKPAQSKSDYGSVEVLIPEMCFFEPGFKFGEGYEKRSIKEQYEIRRSNLLKYLGAWIHFCVIGVSREKTTDSRFEGEYVTSVIGDRKVAMEKLRDMYFFHKNRKPGTAGKPVTITSGSKVEAFVVNVTNQFAVVTSCGVETRIYLHDLTRENVSSAFEVTYVGDVLKNVRVLRVEIKDNAVRLRLTNNSSEASKAILSMKPEYVYPGRVTWYNEEKGVYTVYLDNGVTAYVKKENVAGHFNLSINDRVAVTVYSIYDNTVGGRAMKL